MEMASVIQLTDDQKVSKDKFHEFSKYVKATKYKQIL
jgi:hypothetical protein